MSSYRCAAVVLATCAAALSLAACSAGVTTAGSPAAPTRGTSAASTPSRPSLRPTASKSATSGTMIQVSGAVGRFPLPPGAKVAENISSGQNTGVIFGLVSPAKVAAFYAQALPKAGYTISDSSVYNESGNVVAAIQFVGHGFKGIIDSVASFTGSGVSLGSLGDKNITTVSFMSR